MSYRERKKVRHSLVKGEAGQSTLVLVLILTILGGALLGPLLAFMGTGLQTGQMHEMRTQALHAADSGVEDAINWLIHGKPTDGNWGWSWDSTTGKGTRTSYTLNGMTVSVTVQRLPAGDNIYNVTSVASAPDGSVTVFSTLFAVHWVQGDLDVEHNTTFYGDVYVTGDVTVENNAKIVGDLIVDGDLTTENNSKIEGDVSVRGDVTLLQYSKITGVVCARGDVTLENNVTITGDMYIEGDLTLGNNSHIQGNVFIKGDISIAQNADITGNVYAYDSITIWLNHPQSKIFGAVYATGNVTVMPSGREGNIRDGIHAGADSEDYPELPACPGVPVAPADIYLYEVR
jgi:cytoskeletal protein CcmA (bactofilin family)